MVRMKDRWASMLGRRSSETRTLALMLALSSTAALAGAVAPMTPAAPRGLNAVLAGVGLVLVVAVWCTSWRGWRHLGPLVVVAGVSAIVASAATPAGTATAALGFVWVVLHAALSFGRWLTRAYVGVVAASLGVALAVNPFQGAAHTWTFVVLTTAVAAEALSGSVRRLDDQAATDPLTRLLNRAGLERSVGPLLAGATRSGSDLTLVVIDLDGFKGVNDRLGHAAGDQLLVDLADAWTRELRPTDLLARWGGDEFVLVLPGTDVPSAREAMQRLAAVSPSRWSYGLAAHRHGVDLAALLADADRVLYAAKARRSAVPPGPVELAQV